MTILIVHKGLVWHINRRSYIFSDCLKSLILIYCESEIADPYLIIALHKNVIRFDISVNYALGMNGFVPINDLLQYLYRLLLWNFSLSLDILGEGAFAAQLRDYV